MMRINQLNPTRSDILEKLRDFLELWIPDPDSIEQVTENTNMLTDLGLDSIGILQVTLSVEQEFGISINNNELDAKTFSMVGNLINLIRKKIDEDN